MKAFLKVTSTNLWLIELQVNIFNNDWCRRCLSSAFLYSLFIYLFGDHCKYVGFNVAHVDPSLNPEVPSVDAPSGTPRVADCVVQQDKITRHYCENQSIYREWWSRFLEKNTNVFFFYPSKPSFHRAWLRSRQDSLRGWPLLRCRSQDNQIFHHFIKKIIMEYQLKTN